MPLLSQRWKAVHLKELHSSAESFLRLALTATEGKTLRPRNASAVKSSPYLSSRTDTLNQEPLRDCRRRFAWRD